MLDVCHGASREAEKPGEKLKTKAAEMEWSALKGVINLDEVSQLVDLPELLAHRVVEECVALLYYNGTYRKTQKPGASSSRSSIYNM